MLALAVTAFSGCQNDLTTSDPTKVGSDVVLTSTSGLQKVLTSAYHDFLMGAGEDQTAASFQGVVGFSQLYDMMGEDIVVRKNYGASCEDLYNFAQGRTNASNGARRMWKKCYNIINQTNLLLDNIDEANGSDADKAALRGQALAIRAFTYFNLVMNYQQTYQIAKTKRGVILRLHADDPASMGFSTVDETYQQIVKDLTEAKTALANYSRDEKWQVDKDVVSGMLARVYQVMGNWQGALTEATAVYNNYSTLMSKEEWYDGFDDLVEKNVAELVWGVPFTAENNIGSNAPFNMWYNYEPSFGEGQMDSSIYNFLNCLVSQDFVDLFANDPNDYRGTRCDKAGADVTDADEMGVMFWHRAHEEITDQWAYNKIKTYGNATPGSGVVGAKNYGTSWPLMRGSEMLLIMAEASEHVNQSGKAHLNTLRTTRGANAYNGTDVLEEIYKERRRELLGEGLTGAYDLLRLDRELVRHIQVGEGASIKNKGRHLTQCTTYMDGFKPGDADPVAKLPANDYRFICQIPELEIANNEAIDQSCQNPEKGR